MSDSPTANDLAATGDALDGHDVEGVVNSFADHCMLHTLGALEANGNRIEGAARFMLHDGRAAATQAFREDRLLHDA